MTSELQTVQDIPIELHPFLVLPYGDQFVVKNMRARTFIFIDKEERFLLECLKTPAPMAILIQKYQQKFGEYSYKKVFEFIALLLSASFLAPTSQTALTATDLFRPFAPPASPRVIVTMTFSAPEKIGRFLAKVMDSRLVIGFLAILALYCSVHLFARQNDFEWLAVHGSFSLGLAVWFAVLAVDFNLKEVFKCLLLKGKGLDASGSGIRITWGLPKFLVKDTDILTQGPDHVLRFHLASLLFPAVFSLMGILLFEHTHIGLFGIWSYTGLLVIFLELSPFLRGEFLTVMDRLSGKNRKFETLKNFVHRKFVGRIFSHGSTFQLQARLIAYGIYLYSLLWLYVAHLMAREVLERNLGPLTATILSGPAVDRLCALAFVFGILFPFFGVVAGVIRLLFVNLYTIFEKPLNAIFNQVGHVIRRFSGMPITEISEFLKDIPLFAHLPPNSRPKLAEQLAQYMVVEYFRPGRTVVWQGRPGDAFYTIYEGEAEVFRERSKGNRTLLATLSARDSFGEIALIKHEPRNATVKARSALTCLVLRKPLFDKFVATCLDNEDEMTKLIQWNTILKKLPMFADLPAEAMARMILEMSERAVDKGEAVIREGDEAAEFYILREGAAEVWKDYGGPGARLIATLGPGSHFGEIALFEDSPRTASVIAKEPCRILVMSRKSFFKILRTSIFSGMWIEETSRGRLAELSAKS